MQVRNVMSESPMVFKDTATIREVASCMRDNNHGILPVYRDEKLLGMVTDRDLTIRAIADGRNPDEPVSSVMTDDVLYCFVDDDVREVLKNMSDKHVQRLIVLDNASDKNLVGLVTIADIADHCSDEASMKAVVDCCRHYH